MAPWQHKLLLDLACNPDQTAEDIAKVTAFKCSSVGAYLRYMVRDGLLTATHHEEDGFRAPNTYAVTEAGEQLFDEIVSADVALKRLARRQRRQLSKR